MSCREFEGLIALHVEGDLAEAERRRVELHLRTCSNCWDLAEELRESQEVFKSMRQEVADQSELASVRARVLADIADMESGNFFERWFWGGFRQWATLAALAILIMGGAVLWFSVGREVPSGPAESSVAVARVPVQPELIVEPAPTSPPKPAARLPRRQKSRPVVAPQESQPKVTIRLLTDDPHVIIYWLGDEKGD